MPRFYLHLFEADADYRDDEGQELTDQEAARRAAITGLRDTLAGAVKSGELDLGCYIAVEAEDRREVDRVYLPDAVRITNKTV